MSSSSFYLDRLRTQLPTDGEPLRAPEGIRGDPIKVVEWFKALSREDQLRAIATSEKDEKQAAIDATQAAIENAKETDK